MVALFTRRLAGVSSPYGLLSIAALGEEELQILGSNGGIQGPLHYADGVDFGRDDTSGDEDLCVNTL